MGERMKMNYLTSAFPKFFERHGLRRMRFHDLRHSCASLLLANGVPLKHIQEWLGHSDFTTTANIYAHLDYSSKITSAQAMENGLIMPENGDFESRWKTVWDNPFFGEVVKEKACKRTCLQALWRRVRDSNPRFLVGTQHFECCTFDLSDNSPCVYFNPLFSSLKFRSKNFWREKQERTLKNIRFSILKTLLYQGFPADETTKQP